MSGRSSRRARPPLAPRPTVGRHLRRIVRAEARRQAGDFTALVSGRPLDLFLRRLANRAAAPRRTRNGAL